MRVGQKVGTKFNKSLTGTIIEVEEPLFTVKWDDDPRESYRYGPEDLLTNGGMINFLNYKIERRPQNVINEPEMYEKS